MRSKALCCWIVALRWLLGGGVDGTSTLFHNDHGKSDGLFDDIPTTKLGNGKYFPLVGLGVGNLQHHRIEDMIYEGLKGENRVRLFDTAHASQNEHLVARGIVRGVHDFKESKKLDGRVQVHVVTKIWYTHLGYERTKLSVRESLEALGEAIKDYSVDLKVHMLLHWPRCYDSIEWMNCEAEEDNLPLEVKKLGPPPHLDRENSWKQSWKALEDMYESGDYPAIASIGVSNFNDQDMKALLEVARIPPHLTQINIWSLLFDRSLYDMCNEHGIHLQLYNIMNGVVGNAFTTRFAHHHILEIANLASQRSGGTVTVSAAQVILKWLVQYEMSVIPRTSNVDRLHENSAMAIQAIPNLLEKELDIVGDATAAILGGKDMANDVYVKVTFYAVTEDMFLYFIAGQDDQRQVAFIKKGSSYQESTHPHHKFRLYHAVNPDNYHDYVVEGKYGDHKEVRVEL